jgi:hypothetical protein
LSHSIFLCLGNSFYNLPKKMADHGQPIVPGAKIAPGTLQEAYINSGLLPSNLLTGNKAYYNLISMFTPAGRSKRISASTVFDVGSKISIKRL